MLALSCAVSLAVLGAALSQAIQSKSSATALLANPFNDTARIAEVLNKLADPGTTAADVEPIIQRGVHFSPADARYLSLLGTMLSQEGKDEEAQQYFQASLTLTSTELTALSYRLAYLLRQGDVSAALPLTTTLARRWPNYWSQMEPYLPAFFVTPEAADETAKAFLGDAQLRSLFVNGLIKDPKTIVLARELLDRWKNGGVPLEQLTTLSNRVSNALFDAKDYTGAFLTFRAMLDPEQEGVSGYIHNSLFEAQSTGNRFDWRVVSEAGAVTKIGPKGLEITFRDSPVQFKGLSQFFRLPAGAYDLNVRYTSRDLVMPKPLRFIVSCGRSQLVDLPVQSGTNEDVVESAAFQVSEAECDVLLIRLVSDFVASSWSNRYRGGLTVREVSVNRSATGS